MATGPTTTTQIDNDAQTMIGEMLRVREHVGVMDKLTDTVRLLPGHALTYNEPYTGALVAVTLSEALEYDSPQQFSDTNIQVTASEYGCQILIPYLTNEQVKEDLFAMGGRLLSAAIEYKRDATGLTQLDSFGGSLGSGTATLVVGHITAASETIRAGLAQSGGTTRTGARSTGDPSEGEIFAVVHGYQRRAITAQLTGVFSGSSDGAISTTAPTMNFGTNRTTLSEQQIRWLMTHDAGYTPDGVRVIVDNNLTIASSAAKGAVFARDAIIHLKYLQYRKKDVETDDGRARKITVRDFWGWGERNDIWGVELNVAAVTPTT